MTSTTENISHAMPAETDRGWFKEQLMVTRQWLAAKASVPFSQWLGNRDEGFAILAYHRVAACTPGVVRPTLNVTPRLFERQIVGLLERDYQAWPLKKAVNHHVNDQKIPGNVFVVTFDDGFENVYENAFPILERYNVPATVFLATRFLDDPQPFYFDSWSAKGSPQTPASSWRPLTTEKCLRMQDGGLVELAAHTHTHGDFQTNPDAFRADMENCLDVLVDRFGVYSPTFAYPYGICSEEMDEIVRSLDICAAVTTECELVRPTDDHYRWGRLGAEQYDTANTLAAKVDGWYSYGRSLWGRLRRPFGASADLGA